MLKWFRSGEASAPINSPLEEQRAIYRRYQWEVIIHLILGYSFFYTTRLSLSVAKKPLIDSGVLTKEQLGMMGSGLFFVYAFGKFSNGFLADHANIKRFMSFGLFMSALINLAIGFLSNAYLLIGLWALNGWFQSMGSAPSCVSIFQWFEPKRRGPVYSTWAGSHNIGEGITFVITSLVISQYGWRSGFITPALLSLCVSLLMFRYLRDRPAVYGLPRPEVMFDSTSSSQQPVDKSRVNWKKQLFILRSPTVWIISMACAMMYVSRYAINSWAILFLQETKGYTLIEAGAAMSFYPIAGLIGAVASGWLSDGLFNRHRPLSSTVYAFANIGGMGLLFWGPNSPLNDAIALTIFGFGIGGLIVFLAGLIAAELMPKEVVGAVKGFIGLFAYIGAASQEYISSILIKIEKVEGVQTYDFSQAQVFWFGAGVASMLLTLLIWNKRPEERAA